MWLWSHSWSEAELGFEPQIRAPGPVLSTAVRISLYLKPPTFGGGWFYYYSPFTDEETEAFRGKSNGPRLPGHQAYLSLVPVF